MAESGEWVKLAKYALRIQGDAAQQRLGSRHPKEIMRDLGPDGPATRVVVSTNRGVIGLTRPITLYALQRIQIYTGNYA